MSSLTHARTTRAEDGEVQPVCRPRAPRRARSGTARRMDTRWARRRPGMQAWIGGVKGGGGRSRGARARTRVRTKRRQRSCASRASGPACNPRRAARAAAGTRRAVDTDGEVPPPPCGGRLQVKATTWIGWTSPCDVRPVPCASARGRPRLTGSRFAPPMIPVEAAAEAAAAIAGGWLMRTCTRAGPRAGLTGQLNESSPS